MRNRPAFRPARRGATALLLALAWLLVAGPAGAQAPTPQAAASGAVGEDRNIYTAGGQVRPAGPVQGALAVLALYPVLLLAGFVVGVLFIARQMPQAIGRARPVQFGPLFAYFALALLLVLLLGGLPFAGAALVGVISLAGIGACVLEVYRRRRPGAAL